HGRLGHRRGAARRQGVPRALVAAVHQRRHHVHDGRGQADDVCPRPGLDRPLLRAGVVPLAVRLASTQGRWVIAATVLGSSMAFLDATVVNVALPTIGRDLHTSLAGLQWTVTAYTLTLAGLILLGGALGDRRCRRRTFVIRALWSAPR